MLGGSGLSATREDGPRIYKGHAIPERIVKIKGALSPGTRDDVARTVLDVGLNEMLPSVPLAHQVLHLLDHFELADIHARTGVRRQRVFTM